MFQYYNVLFLCAGNSARSKGVFPSSKVRPEALKQLEAARLPKDSTPSKSWDEFAGPGASVMNYVFTVCDNAGKEVCLVRPGSR
jgi:arsenate reductase (thioredoxin)